MREQSFFIPFLMPSLNLCMGKNYRNFHETKQEIRNYCRYYFRNVEPFEGLVALEWQPVLINLSYKKKGRKKNTLDSLNFAATAKAIEDCLTNNQPLATIQMINSVLKDDTKQFVDSNHLCSYITTERTSQIHSDGMILTIRQVEKVEKTIPMLYLMH